MQLRTLGDIKKEDKGKGTTSYTGGAKSGMAVQNDDVVKLMEKASLNPKSAEEYEKEKKDKSSDKEVCVITLYQNGFIVNDEPFREYSNESSKTFMAELNKGYIPKQLRNKYPKGGVTFSLSDHTSQTYTPPPPPPYTAFSGQAVSLGGAAKVQPAEKPKAVGTFPVDNNKKKTVVQVRLHNGDKQTIEVNIDTKLQALWDYIKKMTGVAKFDLVSGFPPSALKLQKTIGQLGLEESTIIQRV